MHWKSAVYFHILNVYLITELKNLTICLNLNAQIFFLKKTTTIFVLLPYFLITLIHSRFLFSKNKISINNSLVMNRSFEIIYYLQFCLLLDLVMVLKFWEVKKIFLSFNWLSNSFQISFIILVKKITIRHLLPKNFEIIFTPFEVLFEVSKSIYGPQSFYFKNFEICVFSMDLRAQKETLGTF